MTARKAVGVTPFPCIGRIRRYTAGIALLALTALAAPGVAGAAFQPADLRVNGGEESWHAQRAFSPRWSNPPGVRAAHYRLLDPDDAVLIGDTRLAWAADAIDQISVAPDPGAYTMEVWLENGDGAIGPPAAAKLRFDNSPPGWVEPVPVPGWIGRTSFPYAIHLSHPSGPQPLSGIHGYAVSIDTTPQGRPCAAATCTGAETDLQAGIAGDTHAIGELPEGTNYVHAVAVSGAGVASAEVGTTTLRVDKTDPKTTIAGIPSGWSNAAVRVAAHATDAAAGMDGAGPGEPFTAIRIDAGAPIVASGDMAEATVIAPGIHTVAYYARDAAGNVNDGAVSNGIPNRAPQTGLVRIDREPPALAFAAAQSPADPELIIARARDDASGLDLTRGVIAVRRVGAGEPFRDLATRNEGGNLRARWDSAAFQPGEYEFRATAFDLAGNAATSTDRADGSPLRLHGPLKIPVRLRTRSHSDRARYGRGTWFGGRLLAGRRTPLADTSVRVIERFALGAAPTQRITAVRTAANGRFGLWLPGGPSREVLAEVAPTATTSGASSAPLFLGVKGRVRLRASSRVARVGGRPIVLRGQIGSAGARLPTDGLAIELQFRLPGLPWSEFRTVRSDRRGRFRLAYRFSDDDSRGVRFQFRAYTPAQSGWPYEPAGSLPVVVVGA